MRDQRYAYLVIDSPSGLPTTLRSALLRHHESACAKKLISRAASI